MQAGWGDGAQDPLNAPPLNRQLNAEDLADNSVSSVMQHDVL